MKKVSVDLKSADGTPIDVLEFVHKKDAAILSAWAKHFRNHYCLDSEIDVLRAGTGLSRAEYLRKFKFPDKNSRLGKGIRVGDFAEILVADYLQYILKFHVPRTRYIRKDVRDESTKGGDVLGFRILKPGTDSAGDTLALFESKAQMRGKTPHKRLQHAVDGSAKDHLRKGESLLIYA